MSRPLSQPGDSLAFYLIDNLVNDGTLTEADVREALPFMRSHEFWQRIGDDAHREMFSLIREAQTRRELKRDLEEIL